MVSTMILEIALEVVRWTLIFGGVVTLSYVAIIGSAAITL